ncbi:MAG: hypothetical protein ACRELF_28325, partial [Gemmataceae bacterium]
MSDESSIVRAREIGEITASMRRNELAITGLAAQIEMLRAENSTQHRDTDDRIARLFGETASLLTRAEIGEGQQGKSHTWLMTVSSLIVVVGIGCIGWGGYLNSEVSALLARTVNLEQEMLIQEHDQQSSNDTLRGDIASMGGT